MALYTVFGGRGFIGSEVVAQLNKLGHTVFVPERSDLTIYTDDLGIVIYCAGNGDCKNTPYSVIEANISLLSNILQRAKFSRLIYLSSTRVYMNQAKSNEQSNLTICEDDSRRLFNLTKLVGEEICLKSGREVLIVRPSNVYGVALNSPLFLPSIVRDAIQKNEVRMFVKKNYSKDYISIFDLVNAIYKLSIKKDLQNQVFNIASGNNTTASQIANVLTNKTSCNIVWQQMDSIEIFPQTEIAQLTSEIEYTPSNVLDDLSDMIDDFRNKLGHK